MAQQGPTSFRVSYHVAIEETVQGVVVGAVRVASSFTDPEFDFSYLTSDEALDACGSQGGRFARAARIRLAPLRIRYDVEPEFELSGNGRSRVNTRCAAFTNARWRPGAGFAMTYGEGACSKTRFRAVHIDKAGRLEVRARIEGARPDP
jgi:hypothetical protein